MLASFGSLEAPRSRAREDSSLVRLRLFCRMSVRVRGSIRAETIPQNHEVWLMSVAHDVDHRRYHRRYHLVPSASLAPWRGFFYGTDKQRRQVNEVEARIEMKCSLMLVRKCSLTQARCLSLETRARNLKLSPMHALKWCQKLTSKCTSLPMSNRPCRPLGSLTV